MWRFIICYFIAGIFFSDLNAQSWQVLQSSDSPGTGRDIAADGLGNYFVIGDHCNEEMVIHSCSDYNVTGSGDGCSGFLVKYDSSGCILWTRHFHFLPYSIAVDDLGYVYITGILKTLIKFDPEGNLVFETITEWAHGKSVYLDEQKNIYVTGNFLDTVFFPNRQLVSEGSLDGFVAKFDKHGVAQWVVSGGGSGDDEFTSVRADEAGNVFVTGGFEGTAVFRDNAGSEVTLSSQEKNIVILKYTFNGIFRWVIDGGEGSGTAILPAEDEMFYLTAGTKNGGSLSKRDELGNVIWQKPAGFSVVDLSPGGRGETYLTGTIRGTQNVDTMQVTSGEFQDIFVAKFDPHGHLIFYDQSGAGTGLGKAEVIALAVNIEGHLAITGSFSGKLRFGDLEVNDTSGLPVYFFAVLSDSIVGPASVESAPDSNIKIFPNPVSGELTVVFSGNERNSSVRLSDVNGRILFQKKLIGADRKILINVTDIPPGIYIVEVIGKENSSMKKIIVK